MNKNLIFINLLLNYIIEKKLFKKCIKINTSVTYFQYLIVNRILSRTKTTIHRTNPSEQKLSTM